MLSPTQQKVYQFIRQYLLRQGYAPTGAEIAKKFGLKSRSYVHRCLQAIAEAELINLTPGRRRNIELAGNGFIAAYKELPIIGRIAAGSPIEAIDSGQNLDLAAKILGPNRYVLQVKGDSMIGDNICDGDYVICEQRDDVRKNEIAVVLIDNQEASLKRIKHNADGMVSLIPSNPALAPMIYSAHQVKVQGVYLGLIRLM